LIVTPRWFSSSSGLTVITTASPENFDLLKSRGADIILNYHDADIAQQIRHLTKESLHHALDCIGTEESYKIVAEALPAKSEKPMQVVTLLPTDTWPREDVKITAVLAYTTVGEAFTKFGMDVPAMPAHFEFGVKFWKIANELLAAGRIKVHPVALRKGGLSGIPNGWVSMFRIVWFGD
jgi:NADPH:quinone reductase-like Zn-dependent oxidoreductase